MKFVRYVIIFGVSIVLADGCQNDRQSSSQEKSGPPSVTADLEKLDLCDPGSGAYRVNVMQLPLAPTIDIDPNSSKFINYLQNTADKISWLTFLALNWQANENGTADSTQCFGSRDGLTVWEHWMPGRELFRTDNAPPRAWQAGTAPGGHPKNSSASPIFRLSKIVIIDFEDINAEGHPVPNDHSINTLYEVFYNKKIYDYVMKGGLATVAGQRKFAKTWPSQPDGAVLTAKATGDTVSMEQWKKRAFMPTGGSKDTVFSYSYTDPASGLATAGQMHYYPNQPAIMVKSAWTVLDSPEKMGKYHNRTVMIDGKKVTLGLVALHIAQKLAEAPRWVWSTFEHIDNAPMLNTQGQARLERGVDYLYFDESSNDSASFNKPPQPGQQDKAQIVRLQENTKDRNHLNALFHKVIGNANANSVWLNYQLVGTQWPSDNPDPVVTGGRVQPAIMANALMETYHQSTSSCMGCHVKATFLKGDGGSGFFADFMWGLALVDQLQPKESARSKNK